MVIMVQMFSLWNPLRPHDPYADYEKALLNAGADKFYGTDEKEYIETGGGADYILAGGGDDLVAVSGAILVTDKIRLMARATLQL